jgi:hypothetical protein
MEYWKECVLDALFDAKIEATNEQIDTITWWVEGAHENYGMATGQDCIPNPLLEEIETFKRAAKKQESEHRNQLNGIRDGVAFRRNVTKDSVSIDDDGHVTYDN